MIQTGLTSGTRERVRVEAAERELAAEYRSSRTPPPPQHRDDQIMTQPITEEPPSATRGSWEASAGCAKPTLRGADTRLKIAQHTSS